MTQPTPAAQPAVDVLAIMTGIQDQLDDLTAAVRAQQDAIDALTRAVRNRNR